MSALKENEIVRQASLGALRETLTAMSTEELRAELASCLRTTAQDFAKMASIFRELKNRGEDLSDLRSGLGGFLALIADGNLIPEVLVKFGGNFTLLRAVASLPISDQRMVAETGNVEIVTGADGDWKPREMPAAALTGRQIRQVFGERRLRSRVEQIALLESPDGVRSERKSAIRKNRVRMEPRTRTLLIGKSRVPLGDVMSAISEAAGRQGEVFGEADGPSVGTRLTEQERDRMIAACKAMRIDQSDFIRRAILSWLI